MPTIGAGRPALSFGRERITATRGPLTGRRSTGELSREFTTNGSVLPRHSPMGAGLGYPRLRGAGRATPRLRCLHRRARLAGPRFPLSLLPETFTTYAPEGLPVRHPRGARRPWPPATVAPQQTSALPWPTRPRPPANSPPTLAPIHHLRGEELAGSRRAARRRRGPGSGKLERPASTTARSTSRLFSPSR